MNPLNPNLMSTAERLGELCRLLALGIARLHLRDLQQNSAPGRELDLHFSVPESGHATPKQRENA